MINRLLESTSQRHIQKGDERTLMFSLPKGMLTLTRSLFAIFPGGYGRTMKAARGRLSVMVFKESERAIRHSGVME